MKKKDVLSISALLLIALVIFYPLFYSEYLYTDEAVQLWFYKKDSGFEMFLSQGRYITEKLFQWLFSRADSIHDIIYIRLFSFFGWLFCIPVWYFIIKRIVTREKLPEQLIFFSVLYLICTPPFLVYVSWASCIELFLANTTGLLSGYFLYSVLKYENNRIVLLLKGVVIAAIFGVISLFTYQNGFGCFLLPFLLHLISRPKNFRVLFIGISIYLFIYALYYLLFKYNLRVNNIEASNRTKISIDLFPKIRFFFGRALATPFHFTYLFNEKNILGFIAYALIFISWLIVDFYRSLALSISRRLKIFFLTIINLVLIYLPSLIIKENYASNRTLLALNIAVFFLVINTLLDWIKNKNVKARMIVVLSFYLF